MSAGTAGADRFSGRAAAGLSADHTTTRMTRPKLFLLKPSVPDPKAGPGLFHCPHSAAVEGLLSFHPELRERLEVRYVDFARPRQEVIAELGEAHQVCPVLVLPPGVQGPVPGRSAEGRSFFVGSPEIAGFLAQWAGTSLPHP